MWPVSRTVSNRVLRAVPVSPVPNVQRGTGGVPVPVCPAASHSSLSNQTLRHKPDPYSCLFLPPPAISPKAAYHPHLESLLFLFFRFFCLLGQKMQIEMSENLSFFCLRFFETSRHIWWSACCWCVKCGGRGSAVCLCVALLDMMRNDIMVDATAAFSEMRKVPICLTLAESNVSICHSPQDRTLVFIK